MGEVFFQPKSSPQAQQRFPGKIFFMSGLVSGKIECSHDFKIGQQRNVHGEDAKENKDFLHLFSRRIEGLHYSGYGKRLPINKWLKYSLPLERLLKNQT